MNFVPEVVQVVPHDNYIVDVYFHDGKIVKYDVKPLMWGVFDVLQDLEFYMTRCTVINKTLAWDRTGTRDPYKCLDIDPEVIYRE